jgi:hypothetical protein
MLQFDIYKDASLAQYDQKEVKFLVQEAIATYSKAGNPMLMLKLHLQFETDKLEVTEFLLTTGDYSWKFKRFVFALGFQDHYNKGCLDENELVGKSGLCKTVVEENKDTGQEQVRIKYYIVENEKQKQEKSVDMSVPIEFDDQIPF